MPPAAMERFVDEPDLVPRMGRESRRIAEERYDVHQVNDIILEAMGFPTSMFTVLFALARTVGWLAQWKEMIEDPDMRISRPRQLYVGATKRPYVDIKKR